jgi:putative DNA primase/helicase
MCGGRDRWRWTNYEDAGCWVCTHCGTGSGINLIMRLYRLDYRQAASKVESVISSARAAPPKKLNIEEQRRFMRRIWRDSLPIKPDCIVGRYLAARSLPAPTLQSSLRHLPHAKCDGKSYHAMIAKVVSPDGVAINIHRTFLDGNGSKAELPSPRKMMPGQVPPGSAVRLFPAGETLAVGEGIETCLAAHVLFDLPVWSAIDAGKMEKFIPPPDTKELVIMADRDENHVGTAAAEILAKRVHAMGVKVRVEIPDRVGEDWNDVLIRSGR